MLMVFGVFFASAVTVNAGTNSHPWYEVYPNALTNNWRFWGYGEYLFYIDSSGATMYPHDSFPKSSGNTSVYVPQWVYNPRDYDTAASGGTGGYWPDFPVAGVTGFENFDSIWYVTLNPKHVNSQAFKNCTNLRKINISNNLISIYDESFDGCYRLEKVTFSYTPNLMSIDKGAFSYCSNLTGFYNDNDNSICVLDDLYYIGEEAFLGCLKLTDFCCPNVKEIGQKAFKGCESLKSFLFSDNITAIKNGTFEGCSSLRQVYLSDSITSIGERAFADTSIYKLYIPPTVTEIADDAFADSALSMIYGENDSYAETWAIEHGIPFYGAYEYTVNTDNTVTITKCNLDTIRNIPTTLGGKTVTRIGNSAFRKVNFYECGSYTCPLNLNADIKYIGEYAFSECNITKIENLYAQTIAAYAFYGCFYLTSIENTYNHHITDSIDAKTIGDMAFNSCNLEKMTFSKNITSIGTKAIGYNASKKIDGFTIYGYSNTVAKTYADENGFTFVPLVDKILDASCTVTEPVAGQKPSYTATVPAGKGYQVEEDFTDGTWVNGVLWQNDTDHKDMTESDTFEAGKQYTVTVLLDSAAGYSFASNVSGTLNGKNAEVISYGNSTIGVYRTFTFQTTAILGDVDGDGKVDVFDASSIQKSIAGMSGYPNYNTMDKSDPKFRIADVDKDGKVDVFDASLIQKYIAGSTAAQTYGIGEVL